MQSETQPLSRRDRKKQATRDQIKSVATKLFREHGFEKVTIAQIANAADVDVTTFWRHFRSKLAILCSDQQKWTTDFRETLISMPPEMPILDAAVGAMVLNPLLGETELAEIRSQLGQAEESPETKAAILALDDVMRWALTNGLADRLGVDRSIDPRPQILSGAIVSAMHWFSEKTSTSVNATTKDAGSVIKAAVAASLSSEITG